MKNTTLHDVRDWLQMAEVAQRNKSTIAAAACLAEALARLTLHLKTAFEAAIALREGRAA